MMCVSLTNTIPLPPQKKTNTLFNNNNNNNNSPFYPIHIHISWVKPDVYPLFAALGAGIVAMTVRLTQWNTMSTEPRWNKAARIEGELCTEKQGMAYREHFVRRFVRGKASEIVPGLNNAMAGATLKP